MFTVSRIDRLILLAVFASASVPATAEENPLVSLKRICVDTLAGDESLLGPAKEIAIAALFSSKRFAITEKCEKADAVLKGAVLERAERRVRAEGESTDFGVAAGGAHATAASARGGFGAALGGSGENLMSSETRTHASVTLRLVNKDGDVVWAYTQDSTGGKTKSALADAVERGVRQLLTQAERAETKGR